MQRYFIGIGSNIDPEENQVKIIDCFLEITPVFYISRVLETRAVGLDEGSNPRFLNSAVSFVSELNESSLKERLNEFEERLGRDRNAPNSQSTDRPADLDILFSIAPDAKCVEESMMPSEPYMRPQVLELAIYLGISCDLPLNTMPRGVSLFYKDIEFGTHTVQFKR